jgi:uncharacterized protein
MSEPRPILLISGASGLVGSHLIEAARERYDLRLLTRSSGKPAQLGARWLTWDPGAASRGDEGALERLGAAVSGAHAIVNLAGASIADGRLGAAHRRRVLESRLASARALLLAQRRAERPAAIWFQASATGFYGDRGDALLTEDAPPGDAPLSEICRAWEAAPEDAGGAQLVVGRLGIVLAPEAEAWNKLLLPIKLSLGGPLGSGQQWLSWIDAGDLARAILFLIEQGAAGVYNLTAPEPVRQLELTRQTAARLGRPAVLPTPAFALRLALGGLADALILASARVVPERLQDAGFAFRYPTLESELEHLL